MKSLFTILLYSLTVYPCQGQTDRLPTPSGNYSIGVTYLSFTDDSRKELFDNSQKSYREITVKTWYPSDNKNNPEPYILNTEAEFVLKYLQFPEIYKNLITNSSRDVLVSSKENQYPILMQLQLHQ